MYCYIQGQCDSTDQGLFSLSIICQDKTLNVQLLHDVENVSAPFKDSFENANLLKMQIASHSDIGMQKNRVHVLLEVVHSFCKFFVVFYSSCHFNWLN